jgi:APA family basic amino acid/polyamine antiporter
MVRDGLLPTALRACTYRTMSTIFTGVAVAVCAMFTASMRWSTDEHRTLFRSARIIGIVILRRREPLRPRAFKTPFVPFVPICGVIACIYLVLGLPWITWIRFGLWLLVGLVIYFAYGRQRSALVRERRR